MTEAAIPVNKSKYTTKQIAVAGIILLILIIGFAYYFYSQGKKTTTIAAIPVDQPTGTNNSAGVSDSEISQISSDLHADMDGFNYAGHNVEPYQKLDGLSDTDFVKVYNLFNTNYQPASKETLKGWIDDEDYAFNDVVESIIARMGRLDLK